MEMSPEATIYLTGVGVVAVLALGLYVYFLIRSSQKLWILHTMRVNKGPVYAFASAVSWGVPYTWVHAQDQPSSSSLFVKQVSKTTLCASLSVGEEYHKTEIGLELDQEMSFSYKTGVMIQEIHVFPDEQDVLRFCRDHEIHLASVFD